MVTPTQFDPESISALMDGEVPVGEMGSLLSQLERDGDLRKRWSRYHLASDVLHKTAPPLIPLDLAERVAAAVAQEPHHLVVRRHRFTPPSWIRQVAGLAVAASVTAITILTVQTLTTPAVSPNVHLVSVGNPHASGESVAHVERSPSREAKLTTYLVNHSEYLMASGTPGAFPYVRLVGHSSE